MGSAGGVITEDHLALARRLGRRIAELGCVIVTGACPGLPHAAVLGAHEAGGQSLGVSPARSREEHVEVFESPLDPYSAIRRPRRRASASWSSVMSPPAEPITPI